MKKYRLDEEPKDNRLIWDEEEDLANRGTRRILYG